MKLKKYKIIYYILFDKFFFNMLTDVIEYALIHYHDKRGNKAADVLAFDCTYSHKIMKKEKNDK